MTRAGHPGEMGRRAVGGEAKVVYETDQKLFFLKRRNRFLDKRQNLKYKALGALTALSLAQMFAFLSQK